jgi:outer membrane protein assembly factor BamB
MSDPATPTAQGRLSSPLARATILGAALVLIGTAPSHGQWTQWRGPERDGSVRAGPREWPPRLELLWQRDVGGGYAGPVTDGRRVWVHSRRGGNEVVSSLRLDDGELVWRGEYPAPFQQDPSAINHGKGPYPTPALADGRLFTFGARSVLTAWDAGSGDLLWRADYASEFDPAYPYFGAVASPLVWGGLCFVPFGGATEQDPGRGAMMALRVADGQEAWRWTGEAPATGASPIVREIAGQPHLVFKSKALIVGVDPQTGRELWRIPFRVSQDNTIVTPVFVGDRLITSDYQMGAWAWRILPDGGGWSVRELWENPSVSIFTSSPVLAAGLLVGLSETRKGELFGLDPANGEIRWRGEPRWGEHASLIARGNEVLVFREDGSLLVGKVSLDGFETIRRYGVGGSLMWAHPAILGDRIIVRDGDRIAVYGVSQVDRPDAGAR